MIAFINDHRATYGVEPICKVLPIAPSTYHAHAARRVDPGKASARARRDAVLRARIRQVFAANFAVYGVRKIWRQLGREGTAVARCTVARLMRQMGLRGVVRGKEVRTTVPDKAMPCPADRVNRQFRASRPNLLWLADFTYVATWQGFVYVAFVRMPSPGATLAGACRGQRMPASSSMPWSRHCMTAGRFRAAASFIIAIAGFNTYRFATPSASPRSASNHPSAALATATTMHSPKPSMACSRLS
jgi:putative transposase